MTLLFKQLYGFIKLLNSDTGTNQLAAGMACGIILGFAPTFSIQTLIVFLLVFMFRIQAGAAFATAFFFKLFAWLLDPAFHALGSKVLELESMRPLYITLYNMPIIPLTRFNNSIVMGAALVSFILAIPGFFIFKVLIEKYRTHILLKFGNTKLAKLAKSTALYKWYAKYQELYG